jgi:alpha-L-fucosidase
VWIDIPGVLGRGYRSFLYQHITSLQPQVVVVANHGVNTGESFREAYVWPCDAISMEQTLPPDRGHECWRTIQGREYYIAGECCATLGDSWFHTGADRPRPDAVLAGLYQGCRARGVNLLLNVPPDRHGLIEDPYIRALDRLRRGAGA